MKETMSVYVCTRCKVLLIKIDAKVIQHTNATLDAEYLSYVDDNEPGDYESTEVYECPMCNSQEPVIKSQDIPQDAVPQLIELWQTLKEEDDTVEDYQYGIPINEPRFIQLMAEVLL